MELKILVVLHHLLILKPFLMGNRLKQKENYGQGRVGEQEWLGNALIRSYSPSQRA